MFVLAATVPVVRRGMPGTVAHGPQEEEGLDLMEARILRCVPATEPLPGPGVRRLCDECGKDVWVSLKSLSDVDRGDHVPVCIPCTGGLDLLWEQEQERLLTLVFVAIQGIRVWQMAYLDQMARPWQTV